MKSVRRLASFLRPYLLWAILAPLLMLLEVAMDLTQPWMIERIIDDYIYIVLVLISPIHPASEAPTTNSKNTDLHFCGS